MDGSTRDTKAVLQAVGTTIRVRRQELGMSQEELAHRAGLHRTYISDVERGVRNVALINLVRLADALHVPITDLFTAEVFGGRSTSGGGNPRNS